MQKMIYNHHVYMSIFERNYIIGATEYQRLVPKMNTTPVYDNTANWKGGIWKGINDDDVMGMWL